MEQKLFKGNNLNSMNVDSVKVDLLQVIHTSATSISNIENVDPKSVSTNINGDNDQ